MNNDTMYEVDIRVTSVTCSNQMHIEVTYEDHLKQDVPKCVTIYGTEYHTIIVTILSV
jgi:hypothetical protein